MLVVPNSNDFARTWLAACDVVDAQPGHQAYNVIMEVDDPTDVSGAKILQTVDAFLREMSAKPVATIANTIFPQSLLIQHGPEKFRDAFHANVLPKVRKSGPWSGYYFERMTQFEKRDGKNLDQLAEIVRKISDPNNQSRNKLDLAIFDPDRDVNDSPYGGQCLSYLSFKIVGNDKRLCLTAVYRNHYYMEKLLGNLMGLSNLLSFVASTGGLKVGSLTVLSTHAIIDHPGKCSRGQLTDLLAHCRDLQERAQC